MSSTGFIPLVSIIVPVFNTGAEALLRFLNSAANQTYRNIEILLVDDGSVHETAQYLDQVAEGRGNVRVLHAPHAGVSVARNIGISSCDGDYVVFADSDDEITTSYIEEAVWLAENENADLVCGRVVYRFASNNTEYPFDFDCGNDYIVVDDNPGLIDLQKRFLSEWPIRDSNIPGSIFPGPVAKLYRKSILNDVRFNQAIAIGEDSLFNFHVAQQVKRVVFVDRAWYIYYQNAGSSLHFSNNIPDAIKKYRIGYREPCEVTFENYWVARDCHHLLNLAEQYLRSQQSKECFGNMIALFRSSSYFDFLDTGDFALPVWTRLVLVCIANRMSPFAVLLLACKTRIASIRGKDLFNSAEQANPSS